MFDRLAPSLLREGTKAIEISKDMSEHQSNLGIRSLPS